MLTLYISSDIHTTPENIAKLLSNEGVECQVYQNYSSYKIKDSCVPEVGYKIKIFDIDKSDFKDKVWNIIQTSLNLKCAFVKYRDEYRGCVLNWPNVFTKSNCEWEIDQYISHNNI